MYKIIDTTKDIINTKVEDPIIKNDGEVLPKEEEEGSGSEIIKNPIEGPKEVLTDPSHIHTIINYDELDVKLDGEYLKENYKFENVDEIEYIVTDTTDGKYIGTLIPNMNVGDKYIFGDYVFEVVKKKSNSSEITLSNSNYVIQAKHIQK